MQIEEQPAFLIHSRKYTDSRIIIELLTRDFGRVSGVLRQGGKSSRQAKIQPFTSLLVNWKGNGALKTVTHKEALAAPIQLLSGSLFCGLYLNELLLRSLPLEDNCDSVYRLYHKTISLISSFDYDEEKYCIEAALRKFEFALLTELGFGVDFYSDIQQEEIVRGSERFYRFIEGEGFMRVVVECDHGDGGIVKSGSLFPSDVIVALREERFDESILKYAKYFCRQALRPLIGEKPLNTRALFTR
ncbi:MAG: DNA repair protein RecO [Agarilytica sp.]